MGNYLTTGPSHTHFPIGFQCVPVLLNKHHTRTRTRTCTCTHRHRHTYTHRHTHTHRHRHTHTHTDTDTHTYGREDGKRYSEGTDRALQTGQTKHQLMVDTHMSHTGTHLLFTLPSSTSPYSPAPPSPEWLQTVAGGQRREQEQSTTGPLPSSQTQLQGQDGTRGYIQEENQQRL